MTHTHLPRAEAEEEIENCPPSNEDFQEGTGLQTLEGESGAKVGKSSLEETSSAVGEDADAEKKKEDMKAKLSARYVPHLMFEITSDDGFRVLSDSVNSELKRLPLNASSLFFLSRLSLLSVSQLYLLRFDFILNRSLEDCH